MTKTTTSALDFAIYLSVLALGAITLWVGVAHAESTEKRSLVMPVLIGDGPGMLIPAVLQAVELTNEQEAAVSKVLRKEGPPMREILTSLRNANLQLAEKTFAPEFPQPADTAGLLRRIADLRGQLMRREMAMLLGIRAVLKPEQLAHIERVNQAVIDDFRHPVLLHSSELRRSSDGLHCDCRSVVSTRAPMDQRRFFVGPRSCSAHRDVVAEAGSGRGPQRRAEVTTPLRHGVNSNGSYC